jgi:hypothetical protein
VNCAPVSLGALLVLVVRVDLHVEGLDGQANQVLDGALNHLADAVQIAGRGPVNILEFMALSDERFRAGLSIRTET